MAGPDDTGPTRLSAAERLSRLRLIRSRNIGPATFLALLDHCGSAEAALEALPELSRRGGQAQRVQLCPLEQAEAEIKAADRVGATLVACGEPGYPPWLAAIDAPPPLVYVKGLFEIADRPIVAIVGSRNGSAIGRKLTRQLAADLGASGFVISSGLARGIDTAAHSAALDTGTIAVLAGGIDSIYPPENADLHAAIGERGLLLSERPPGFQPRGQDFPRRNRLISGMSAGVIVVEAAQRSGSLITARLAGEQGREVFAVPGNPLDPRAAGTNRLLRDGAGLATSAEDVVSALAPILGRRPETPEVPQDSFDDIRSPPKAVAPGDTERDRVVACLTFAPIDIDEIIRASGLAARHVHAILLELELAGQLDRHGRQLVSLRAESNA
ncbi:MAG: DNA-processing protein DprA [Methyloligellaceae bacterium]